MFTQKYPTGEKHIKQNEAHGQSSHRIIWAGFCSCGENLLSDAVTHTAACTSSTAALLKSPGSPPDWLMTQYQVF